MATVETFDRGMIKNYLEEKDLNYFEDRDGDFIVRFNYDEDWGCALDIWFIVNNSVYKVQINSTKPIPREDWGKTMMLCNTWHQQRRWPRAYLYIENPETDENGFIILNGNIDLEEGIHQELLDDWTGTIISAGFGFWKWAHQEQGL